MQLPAARGLGHSPHSPAPLPAVARPAATCSARLCASAPQAAGRHAAAPLPAVGLEPRPRRSAGRQICHATATQPPPAPSDSGSDAKASSAAYVADLQQRFGIPGCIDFLEGRNGLPRIWMQHPSGQCCEIYLQGACITRWTRPDGGDHLFLRPDAAFAPGKPINSGVGLGFPQWREGILPENGFSPRCSWEVVHAELNGELIPVEGAGADSAPLGRGLSPEEAAVLADWDNSLADGRLALQEVPETDEPGAEKLFEEGEEVLEVGVVGDPAPCVVLRLTDDEYTRELWPHAFELYYKITLMENDDVRDPDSHPGPVKFYESAAEALADDEAHLATDNLQPAPSKRRGRAAAGGEESETVVEEGEANRQELQLRLEWHLVNNDAAGSPPMEFQLGVLPTFKVADLSRNHDFVRALGLGGAMVVDYAHDPRQPLLESNAEDFLHFGREKVDATYVSTAPCDVMLCPGDRSHYKLMHRSGLTDHAAYHPGPEPSSSARFSDFYAALGGGRIALPAKLDAGEEWHGEHVIRWHNYYWRRPIFDNHEPRPLPRLTPQRGSGDDVEFMATEGANGGLESEVEIA